MSGVGNWLIGFLSKSLAFLRKNEWMSNLIIHSFLVSDQSDLLTSLFKKEGMSESLVILKNVQKIWFYSHFFEWITCFLWAKEWKSDLLRRNKRLAHSLFYHEQPKRINHGCSFFMSNLSDSLKVPLLSWATWAIRSQLLICPEWSERIVHSCSLKWAILSDWAISQWANEWIPSPANEPPHLQMNHNIVFTD